MSEARSRVGPYMPLFDPDPQQRAALEHARGTLLLTGGPGSGKTATLVERFARLVEAGADPERVVLFTLSRDGARTVREAILARLARSLPDIPALTFHSFALRVLGASYASLAYPEPPRLLTAPEQYGRVADLLSAEDPSLWPSLGRYLGLRRLRREVADFVLRAQERLLDPPAAEARALERDREDLTEVARFYGRYLDVTQAANEVDFAGLLMQALFVVAREGAGMDQVLVDDFQDVTPAGSGIVRALAERAESTTIAADPDGHVFSFRGGTLEPLAAVIEDADVHRVSLEGSHRLPGQLRALCRELSEERRTDDLQVDGWRFAQPAQEADAVARALLREHMDGAVPWGRMAVIVRRYGDYLPVLRRSFQHHGVPYLAVGEASAIASEAAVRPVVTLLRFALHPDRREELVEELLVSPVGALHPHDVRALRRAAKTAKPAASVLAVVEEPPSSLPEELRTRLAGIVALVDEAADRAARLAPDEVFQWLWERLPYLSGLVEEAEGSGEANRHLDAVDAFAASLARFAERRPGAPILDYLDAVEQVEFGADPFTPAVERTPEAVRVLTAHGAHGKEFDVAFVVGTLNASGRSGRSSAWPSPARPASCSPRARPATRAGPARRRGSSRRDVGGIRPCRRRRRSPTRRPSTGGLSWMRRSARRFGWRRWPPWPPARPVPRPGGTPRPGRRDRPCIRTAGRPRTAGCPTWTTAACSTCSTPNSGSTTRPARPSGWGRSCTR